VVEIASAKVVAAKVTAKATVDAAAKLADAKVTASEKEREYGTV
jgi:hypothetical protein